jgi:hypothetical protein
MALDTTKLEAALKAGDEANIRKEFSAILDRPYTDEENGQALLALGQLYTTLMNSVNQDYVQKLRAIKEGLDALNSGKKKIGEAVKLAEARAGLAK